MSDTAQLLAELSAFCKSSDSLSEDGLRQIIQRHNWTPNNPSVQSYDFFLSACCNERVTEGRLRYLLENFPGAGTFIDRNRATPLHNICRNKNVTLGMFHLLIDAFPASVRHEHKYGLMPLHELCNNKNLDDDIHTLLFPLRGGRVFTDPREVANDILRLLLERCPEAVRHADRDRRGLPIHFAAGFQSPEFCRILIEAYPGSERMTDNKGNLPFHMACGGNDVATVKYLYQLYPESVTVANNEGVYPIHAANFGVKFRKSNPENAIEMVQFLLACNPDVVLQELHGKLPLYWVCLKANNEQYMLNAHLKILRILYDAYPEAIERVEVTSNVGNFCEEVQTFINKQLTCARQARDLRQMNTPDENGQLPLHRALHDNVRLGSIKLLVKGNPSAIRCCDKRYMMPLHVACQHHDSTGVVEYLIRLGEDTLDATDKEGNTALHYVCRGAKHGTITLLMEKYGAISVSKRNSHNQLPIDLLFGSEAVNDREGVEYTESIFHLLRAYPATVMNCISNSTQHLDSNISG